jgi:putative PIN family toxin of toxin-antitoxin system
VNPDQLTQGVSPVNTQPLTQRAPPVHLQEANQIASPVSPRRLILDTNILLDLFLFHDPAAEDLRTAFHAPNIQLLATKALLNEFSGVLKKPSFGLSSERQKNILEEWSRQTVLIQNQTIEHAPWKCKDQTDQMFLDLAYSCRPAILISKDKQVLKLRKQAARDGVRITADPTISCD